MKAKHQRLLRSVFTPALTTSDFDLAHPFGASSCVEHPMKVRWGQEMPCIQCRETRWSCLREQQSETSSGAAQRVPQVAFLPTSDGLQPTSISFFKQSVSLPNSRQLPPTVVNVEHLTEAQDTAEKGVSA